jgi:hypothetical protein
MKKFVPKFPWTLVLFLLVGSCSEAPNANSDECFDPELRFEDLESSQGIQNTSTKKSGFFLTSVDSGYTASKLHYNDFKTGKLYTLLTGESSDPHIVWTGDRLYFFNRSDGNSNFRIFTPTGLGFTQTCQTALPNPGIGDPHGVVQLDDDHVAMTYGVAGKVVTMNIHDGTERQSLDNFSTTDGLRSFALFEQSAETLLVPHQGLSKDFVNVTGSQAVFVLNRDDLDLSIKDMDPAKDGNQGIVSPITKLSIFPAATGKLRLMGFCSVYDHKDCVNGTQLISTTDWTTGELSWDFASITSKGNGGIIQSNSSDEFFFLSGEVDLSGEFPVPTGAYVLRVNVENKTSEVLHTYPSGSSGCCSTLYDESTGELYIGDRNGEAGLFTVYPDGATAGNGVNHSLDVSPGSGILVE